MAKTKEELTAIIFQYLQSGGGMNITPEIAFQTLLSEHPEHRAEIKNVLAAIIHENADNWIVYQAMRCLVEYFTDVRLAKDIFYSILGDTMMMGDNATAIKSRTKFWVRKIAEIP